MKVLAIPSEEEFEALPPALRRKFFSNVERFHMRLAHSDPNHVLDYQFNTNLSGAPRCLHFRAFRNRPGSVAKSFSRRRRRLNYPCSFSQVSHKRQKPGSLQVAYLTAQADSQCFHSLPPKIQQKHFSREEQIRLRQAYCDSVILDAADEALYRLEEKGRQLRQSSESLPSQTTTPFSQSSTLYLSDSDSDSDSEDEMDHSLYESFRWLDEDGDLDLSLDEYHAHIADSTPKMPPRGRPSFRRTMSFNSANLARKPMASISHQRIPTSSQSSNVPYPLTAIIPRASTTSRPPSSHRQAQHAPRSSTSSIDPSAQYYQDPEARLKLRVYLASPQKFDEAIEFGFPALENKENIYPDSPGVIEPDPKMSPQKFTGTFFQEEDEVSAVEGKGECSPNISRMSRMTKESQSPTNSTFSSSSHQSGTTAPKMGPRRVPGNREMTLKMTLTRPDLRTESPSISPSSAEDPLKLAELPPASNSPYIWESDTDEQGIMKKMWRRLRKRC